MIYDLKNIDNKKKVFKIINAKIKPQSGEMFVEKRIYPPIFFPYPLPHP